MKKFLMLMLVLVVSIAFTGCGSSNQTVASNIEDNVKKLSGILKQTKDLDEEDIYMKELYNSSKVDKMSSKKISNLPTQKVSKQIIERKMTMANDIGFKRLTNGTYKPRRTSEVDYNNDSLKNYISLIEDIYLMMNDAAKTNNECACTKNEILENCDMLNLMCGKLRKNEIVLNDNQTKSCNDLLASLNKSCNYLNETKNQVKNDCSSCKTVSINPNADMQQVSTKYVKLINSLDNRLTNYNNILSILKQLQSVISGKNLTSDENKKVETNNVNIEKNNEKVEKNVKINEKTEKVDENKVEKTEIKKTAEKVLNNKKTENKTKENKITTVENKTVDNSQNKVNNNKQTELKKENKEIKKEENRVNFDKVADFNTKESEKDTKKGNIDTFKDATFPNIRNINKKNENVNNSQNQKIDNAVNSQNGTNNQNVNNGVNNQVNNGVNNQVNPNGMNNQIITPNGMNNREIINNGINSGVNGIVGPINNGSIVNNGYGIHNYENGVKNPYRNTDTYKLPTGNEANRIINNSYYTGVANFKPLSNEARKNFKAFDIVA